MYLRNARISAYLALTACILIGLRVAGLMVPESLFIEPKFIRHMCIGPKIQRADID